jgi:DNA-binding CsgD family transcriptional regulator
MMAEIVGRERELQAIGTFLDEVAKGTRGLLVAGPAGIGKTAIWQAALASIGERDYRVLSSRPLETEARLSYASLGDLLGDVLDEVADALPSPQRRALDVALLRADSGGRGSDRRAVSIAVLRALQALARSQPVIVAIDDVQWMDDPSAQALSFAVRRLVGESVGVLVTLRQAPGLMDPLDLEEALDSRTNRMTVGPLSVAALGSVVRRTAEREISRPLLVRVHEVSRGNPLFALEIIRAVQLAGGELEGSEPLPVPEDLGRLLRARIETLPEREQEALLVASATPRPTVALAQAALSRPGEDVFEVAGVAGVVRVDRGRVTFSHPLLASAVYQGASARRRRTTHRRLAEVVANDEERARHLALASTGPDAGDATALEEAAKDAYLRGAPDAAAELWGLAQRSTPPEDGEASRRRGSHAAGCAFEAGDVAGARRIANQVLSVCPPGEEHADLLEMLSSFAWNDVIAIRPLLEAAIEEAPDPSGILAAALGDLAWVEIIGGDLRIASRLADRAIEIGERAGEPAALELALITAAHAEFMLGRDATGLLQRATDLERESPGHLLTSARSALGAQLVWSGDLAGARRQLEPYYREITEQGRYMVLWDALGYLAELETRAGDYGRALAYADELLETTVEAGFEGVRELGLWVRALAEAHLGDVGRARLDATEGLAVAERHGDLFHVITNRSVLGFIEMSLGDFKAAHAFLEPLPSLLDSRAIVEPGMYPFIPDAVETLIGIGDLNSAREVLEPYEVWGVKLDRPLMIATAARSRGLLMAADGDLDGALVFLGEAIGAHERVQQPFELGRTLLALGEVRRRAKQKRSAREALDHAEAIFEELGTPIWSARARASLARIGGRSASAHELTESELQVARLAAVGKTNREVAEALFVSAKTVEANLSRAYRKLGISSRRQLAERLDPS